MHKPSVGLSLEGLPMIGLAVVATLSFALLDWEWAAVIGLVLTFFTVNFFRDPERVVPTGQGLAVSPADGKVVKVGRAVDPATGREAQVVCIFMNVFNVHVNRMPVAGTIKRLDYYPGLFLNASLDKASQDNERNVVRITDENDRQWTVVQIAGLIARRIICWAEEGDELARGRRFGLIKFGSRVDLYLPDDYRHSIVMGQKVLAGQTVIARRVDQGD